jgi:predicted SAM-dependent methyltransferase
MMDWRVRRTLRKLQRAYYASPNDAATIRRYFATLSAARGTAPRRGLHAGSGDHHIDGWINVDAGVSDQVEVAADLSQAIPFRGESLDYIHSEDFIEHLDLEGGKRFIAEAYRALRSGGVMRILTPDLRALIDNVYHAREAKHIQWCADALNAGTPCEALNMHLRMNGDHRFIYDEELLTNLLQRAGFRVRRASWNRSKEKPLRFLDLRDFGLNLFLEAVK